MLMLSHQDILIVQKTADFLKHLVPVLGRFPKNQRFLLADRIQACVMDILETFLEAYHSPPTEKLPRLKANNIRLEKLRQYFRVCYELGYYNSIKLSELLTRLNEIGRMNGGWIKSL